MERTESDFERRVRESEEAGERQALQADGKRPLFERWWWFLLVTLWAWPRFILAVLPGATPNPGDLAFFGVGFVVVTVAFLLTRRHGERRRAALRARPGESNEHDSGRGRG